MTPTASAEDIRALTMACCPDPHAVLGVHHHGTGLVFRVFRPWAMRVEVILDDGVRDMTRVHQSGLFEALWPGRRDIPSYQLRFTWPDDKTTTAPDAYSFLPQISDLDRHLWNEGNLDRAYETLGAVPWTAEGTPGVRFAVWAPNAAGVSVVGDFNGWDGRAHQMRILGESGIWELFIPHLAAGELYKFEIRSRTGPPFLKSDPFARERQMRPNTASIVTEPAGYVWGDGEWMTLRRERNGRESPISVYEVHLGSWRRRGDQGQYWLSYRELAEELVAYVKDLGFTHLELLPVMAHPFDASWGYQVTGYFAPTTRYGEPADFMALVDAAHQAGLGVIMDWVPAHFPKDAHGLARFDGTALYEHMDPRQGEHPDWQTLIFNYGRNEVRNFLISSALFWLDRYHLDGLRVDAVASMLYLDYSRQGGDWIPNKYGGRENIEAIEFIKTLNTRVYAAHPDVMMIAEESTAWPGVTRPVYLGGLGFGFKWNMGWMHDLLDYFSKEPVHRKYHADLLTFALLYAFSENFMLPLSHDEVVHGKGALLSKMPGDDWQKRANLRLLLAYMFGQPGKKLLFMGAELGQWDEWSHDRSLSWNLLDYEEHRGLQRFVKDLNRVYRSQPALHQVDYSFAGFEWIDFRDTQASIVSFIRRAKDPADFMVCAFNFTPVPRQGYRIGVPRAGLYEEILNSDAETYGGSNLGNQGSVRALDRPWHNQPASVSLNLPPLGAVYLKYPYDD
jgi:1,4-alpha-glucan branching enzyme